MANLAFMELRELLEKLEAIWLKRPLKREFEDDTEQKLSSVESREAV